MKIEDKLLFAEVTGIIAKTLKLKAKDIRLDSVMNDLVRSDEIGWMDIPLDSSSISVVETEKK